MDKFILEWGFDAVTEGAVPYDTAEQAYLRAFEMYAKDISVGYAHDAVRALKERGEFNLGGEWVRLRNGREACSTPVHIRA